MNAPATAISAADVEAAAGRIAAAIRPVVLTEAEPGTTGAARVSLALEFMQHTGSFKARGAANLAAFHRDASTMPQAGVVIASGVRGSSCCT